MSLIDEVRRAHRLPSPAVAKMIRIEAGVSQERLAREVGVHRMTIQRWENGTRTPRASKRVLYAELLEQLRREVSA